MNLISSKIVKHVDVLKLFASIALWTVGLQQLLHHDATTHCCETLVRTLAMRWASDHFPMLPSYFCCTCHGDVGMILRWFPVAFLRLLIHSWNPIRYYHFGSKWTWEQWELKGSSTFLKNPELPNWSLPTGCSLTSYPGLR